MAASTTVVFADLTGSTSFFETLGNAKATEAVTKLTQWISYVCETHQGRVVKTLGDGVLTVFPDGPNAVNAVVELQRSHLKRIMNWPPQLRMRLQIGVACGEIVEVEGDCFGDAVNVASRLSDLSGADQIWATDTVIEQFIFPPDGVRFRTLGPVNIRGKAEPRVLYRVDWQEEEEGFQGGMTAPASLEQLQQAGVKKQAAEKTIELAWIEAVLKFRSADLPIHIGRVAEAEFQVNDQRVSRMHAKIEWRNGTFVLSDMSTYGIWVRFAGSNQVLALRRDECVLHGSGELALGAPFEDFTVPTVHFTVSGD